VTLLFTFRLIPAIAGLLARRGVDAAALLTEHELPLDALRGEITAPLPRIQAFVAGAARAVDDDRFGLTLAASLPGGAYGTAEFLVRSAASVEEGLRVLCEFAALINPSGHFKYEAGRLHYGLASQRNVLGVHLNEMTLAYIVRQMAAVTEGGLPLADVWFAHLRRTGADEVSRHFGCTARFGAPDCGFALSPATLARAPRTADPLLFGFLHSQAKAQLAHVGPVDIVSQLMRVLEARLPSGEVGAAEVARAMATTSRSLQRHLAGAGTSYREVLAHVRSRRRAELQGGGIGEPEIARRLGFSDARAMRRSLDES